MESLTFADCWAGFLSFCSGGGTGRQAHHRLSIVACHRRVYLHAWHEHESTDSRCNIREITTHVHASTHHTASYRCILVYNQFNQQLKNEDLRLFPVCWPHSPAFSTHNNNKHNGASGVRCVGEQQQHRHHSQENEIRPSHSRRSSRLVSVLDEPPSPRSRPPVRLAFHHTIHFLQCRRTSSHQSRRMESVPALPPLRPSCDS